MAAAIFYGINAFALAAVAIANLMGPASDPPRTSENPAVISAPASSTSPPAPQEIKSPAQAPGE